MYYHHTNERQPVKLLVINNLSSGFGEGSIYDFVRSFSHAEDQVTIRSCDRESEFEHLLEDAASFDAVVASGGDGTVASICYLLRDTGIPILPFPAGTANLLSLNLLSPNEPHALAKLVRTGKHLDFDMGEIEVEGIKRGFTIMAGCGYDATIMSSAQPTKRLLGPMSYFQAAFANPTPQKSHFTITVDGKTLEREGVGCLLVNFSKIQFDFSVTVQNEPRDGALDLVILATPTALDLIPTVMAAAIDHSGTPLKDSSALEYYRGREIHVEADPPMKVQYDGEVIEHMTPFTARVLDKASRLIVTDEGYDQFASESAL